MRDQRSIVFPASFILLSALCVALLPINVPHWPEGEIKDFVVSNWLSSLPASQPYMLVLALMLGLCGGAALIVPGSYSKIEERLRRSSALTWSALIAAWIVFAALFSIQILRHYALSCFALFVVSVWWTELRSLYRSASYYGKVGMAFLFVSFSVKALPGGYLPPFFNGIHGWVNPSAGLPSVITLGGLQLVRNDGDVIWYSNALVLPQNMFYRQLHVISKDDEQLKGALDVYFEIYQHAYPLLAVGSYMSERYLGKYSYPAHSPSRMLRYEDFPPERIVGFRNIIDFYDVNSGAIERTDIDFEYDLQTRKLVRGTPQ